LPASRHSEWEAFLKLENDLEKQRKIEHFGRLLRYIENNPVNTRIVRAPEDWPWSSARYPSKEDSSARTLTYPNANRVPPPARPSCMIARDRDKGAGTARPR
jgi:hypothetical protein